MYVRVCEPSHSAALLKAAGGIPPHTHLFPNATQPSLGISVAIYNTSAMAEQSEMMSGPMDKSVSSVKGSSPVTSSLCDYWVAVNTQTKLCRAWVRPAIGIKMN